MVFTEKEAKEHTCPYARRDYFDIACVASKCMAWRWVTTLSEARFGTSEPRQGTCNLINPKPM